MDTQGDPRLVRKRKPSQISLPLPYAGPRLTDRKLHCYYCECSYPFKSRLARHIQKHFPPEYLCGQCGREYYVLADLKRHLLIHSAPSQFKCQLCNFATKYSMSLKRHVVHKHGTKPALGPVQAIPGSLDQAGLKIEIHPSSITKMKKKAKERSKFPPPYTGPREFLKGYFYCYYCPREFPNKIAIQTHMFSHLPLEFFCKICGYGHSRIDNLRTHYRNHLIEKKFQCQYCSFNTKYKLSFLSHVKVLHSENPGPTGASSISCFHCGWTTKYKSRLIDHLEKHRPPLLKCKQCDYRSSTRKCLRRHVALTHLAKPNECSLCEFKTKYKASLREHTATHTNPPKRFECSFCGFQTRYSGSLKAHLGTHTGEKPYFCHLCDHRSATKTGMVNHFRSHGDFKSYLCPYCNLQSQGAYAFADHLKVEHSNIADDRGNTAAADENPRPCQICYEAFDTKELLLEHLKTHPRERKFKCPHCEYASFLNSTVNEHIRTEHTERKYECHVCDYKTKYKSGLKGHIQAMHEKLVAFNCRFCEYQSFRKRTVKKHEEIHFDVKKYACDVCDFRTRQMTTLKNHKLLHAGGVPRPFQCELCDFKGSSRSVVRRHAQGVHAIERAFKCSFCPKTFKTQQTAKIHEACHTGKTVLECSKCAYTAICAFSLRNHQEKMHTNSSRPTEEELPDTFPNGRRKRYFFCQKCAYYTCQKVILKRHMEVFHPKHKD